MAVDHMIFSGVADTVPRSLNKIGSYYDNDEYSDHATSDPDVVNPYDPDDDEFKLDDYQTLGVSKVEDEDEEMLSPKTPRRKFESDHVFTDSTRKRIKTEEVDTFILHDVEPVSNNKSSRVFGTFGRQGRREGDMKLPAYHRRVTHDLDSDDELIMEMREKNFTDRQIADKLLKEGRTRYDHKSITTRAARIRRAQAENVDLLLADGCREWEYEEDCLLMQAMALADAEIESELERVRSHRWRKVSDYLRDFNKDTIFSDNACRERYTALMDGTATIPSEVADDPEARRAELEAFRKSREKIRNKEQMEKDLKEARERKDKNEMKILNAQKAEETARRRAQLEQEKAQRAVERAAAAQVRAQRAMENANAQNQRNAKFKKQKQALVDGEQGAKGSPRRSKNGSPLKHVTPNTPDPRACLSMADLNTMATSRGLNIVGKTKKEILVALRDADDEWSADDLKKMCRSKGLGNMSTNLQMKYHLALEAAKKCPSFVEEEDRMQDDDDFMLDV